MDPELPVPNKSTVKTQVIHNNKFLIILALAIILVLLAFGFYLWQLQNTPKPFPVQTPPLKQVMQISTQSAHLATFKPDQAVVKVGEELIYKKDLDMELAYYPKDTPVDMNKILLEKLIQDSIILQAADADKLITLDKTVFNSPNKDYMKRMKLIERAKKTVTDQADGIEGSVIAIWFFNMKPAAIGYEKGKEFALAKITKIHDDVKNKKITTQQAADLIKNDTNLAQVDKSYKSNAILNFKATKNEKITYDSEFNKVIWGTEEGGVSDVFLSKDKDQKTDQMIDAVYHFAIITKRLNTGKIVSFDDWINQKRKAYEIKYY